VREIRTLRAMWRVLETELRRRLNGHEDGNVGYSQGVSYGLPRQRPTLPTQIHAFFELDHRADLHRRTHRSPDQSKTKVSIGLNGNLTACNKTSLSERRFK